MNLELLRDVPPAAYHADTEWISNSMLKVFNDSRRKYEARFIKRQLPSYSSKAMDIGTVAHAAILEPHIITDVCTVVPNEVLQKRNGVPCARAGKPYEEWLAENCDKVILTQAELNSVRGMFESVYRHPIATRYLRAPGKCEQSIYWECAKTGVPRRCRLDKPVPEHGAIVDIKTTYNVARYAFSKAIVDYGYHQQAAFYTEGFEAVWDETPDFVFIAVETEAPYLCRVYTLPGRAFDEGLRLVHDGLATLKACQASGDWSDPQEHEVIELDLPRYAYPELSA